eukprot:59435_1
MASSSNEMRLQMNGMNGEHNGYHDDAIQLKMNESEGGDDHESLSDFFLRLCIEHKTEICEFSRENGYALNDSTKFYLWRLRSSLIKLVQIPSDSKLYELLSLSLRPNSKNEMKGKSNENDDALYSQLIYYYLNIQINANECIHVRIYSQNGKREVGAILYKGIQHKLRPF